ncbi:LysE family translocator [Salegentibacter sp. HM20]
MPEQLLPFLTASILLTLSPGPDIIFVLVQGIANGKKPALAVTLGLATGIIIHTSLVAFGVSAVIRQSPNLFLFIKIFGALYLVFLAWKVFQSDAKIAITAEGVIRKKPFALYRQGFIMNVLNPKVSIFFLAFFPGFLWDPEGNTILQFYVLGALFMLQTILIFGSVGLAAGQISKYLKKHNNSGVVLKYLQIIVFLGIAVLILI